MRRDRPQLFRHQGLRFGWTDEHIELLRKFWLEGFSASSIAKRLGGDLTKNAIIGKVHRLGPKLARPSKLAKPPEPPHRVPMVLVDKLGEHRAPVVATPPASRTVDEFVVPICEPVTIMDLAPTSCRWPLSDSPTDDPFLYCGDRAIPDRSYCRLHYALSIGRGTYSERRALEIPKEKLQ